MGGILSLICRLVPNGVAGARWQRSKNILASRLYNSRKTWARLLWVHRNWFSTSRSQWRSLIPVLLLLVTAARLLPWGEMTSLFSSALLVVLLKNYLSFSSQLCNEARVPLKCMQPKDRTICFFVGAACIEMDVSPAARAPTFVYETERPRKEEIACFPTITSFFCSVSNPPGNLWNRSQSGHMVYEIACEKNKRRGGKKSLCAGAGKRLSRNLRVAARNTSGGMMVAIKMGLSQETESSPLSSAILCGSKGQASKERSIPPTGAFWPTSQTVLMLAPAL